MVKKITEKAILGRMVCGHAVAVDLDDTPNHRRELRDRGYKLEILDRVTAILILKKDYSEHEAKCKAKRTP